MNNFDPSYELEEPVTWLFNINHLYLVIGVIAFICFALYIAPRKNSKYIVLNKIFLALLLVGLEIGRIAYYCKEYILENGTLIGLDWVSTISFQMCAMMTWFTAFILIFSIFVKRTNKFVQYSFNFLFGGSMIGAASCFVNPLIMDPHKPCLHFRNTQTVLVHCLLTVIPMILIKWDELKIVFKNVWMNLVGYLCVGAISMCVSLATGHNFAFAKYIPLDNIPDIIFPLQQLVIMLLMFAGDIVLYLGFEAVKFIKIKHFNNNINEIKEDFNFNNKSYYLSTISTILIAISLDMLIAYLVGNRISLLGILCLFPLFYGVLILFFIEYKNTKITENLFSKSSVFIDTCLALNPIIFFGFIYNSMKKTNE